MKRLFLLLIFIPFCLTAQINDSLQNQQNRNEKLITELEQKLNKLQETIDRERNISDKTFNSISNQLSGSSNSLTLFGILFGVLAIAVGFYVTFIERKIVRISEKNTTLFSQTEAVKNEVVEINRLIQSDIEGLFRKIKKEETNHILDRLMKIPKDVANLLQELLSRDLDKADFDKLKISYQKISPTETLYTEKYEILFFQHFSDLALKDISLKPTFVKYIPKGIICSFENDILKSTNDIFQYIVDTGLVNNSELINVYFKGLNDSKFKEYKQLYELINQKLLQRDKQFLLAQLIESNIETEISKINYGTFLIEAYNETELTESERLILEDIKNLRQQKNEREERVRIEKEVEDRVTAEAEANLGNT